MGLANKIPKQPDGGKPQSGQENPLGVYVHVPFCARACDFCAFYQVEPRRADLDVYLDCIEREMALVPGASHCATAFWGGGTPGVLPARDLERLGRAQIRRFGVPREEWTVELAPGSVSRDRVQVMRDLGVNRVSLGVQSLSPRLLEALGRHHSRPQILRAWKTIGEAGFASRNLDLIFAIPGQSIDDWRADLAAAVALQPDHISTYCLTFEEDTALFLRLARGNVTIDPERERAFYAQAWDELAASGYEQYEISNFARPGHACRHNRNTWRMHEWIGLGPSAASQHNGVRSSNVADLSAWARNVGDGIRADVDRLELTPAQLAEDALIFGLRLNEGVQVPELTRRFGPDMPVRFRPLMERLVQDGLARWRDAPGGRLGLTREGRLLADAVGGELIGRAETGAP